MEDNSPDWAQGETTKDLLCSWDVESPAVPDISTAEFSAVYSRMKPAEDHGFISPPTHALRRCRCLQTIVAVGRCDTRPKAFLVLHFIWRRFLSAAIRSCSLEGPQAGRSASSGPSATQGERSAEGPVQNHVLVVEDPM